MAKVPMLPYVAACEHGIWTLHNWRRGDSTAYELRPYRCKSWRHEGPCRRFRAALDFRRIMDAMDSRKFWLAGLITHDQAAWMDWTDQYRCSVYMWSAMRQRILRKWGKFEYVQTWERHAGVGIHCHIAICCENLWHATPSKKANNITYNWWRPAAVACGFGPVGSISAIRSKSDYSKYLSKKAAELIGGGVKDQMPWDAPPHFRRIRASRGLLPKIKTSDEWTGRLIFEEKETAEKLAAIFAQAHKSREDVP